MLNCIEHLSLIQMWKFFKKILILRYPLQLAWKALYLECTSELIELYPLKIALKLFQDPYKLWHSHAKFCGLKLIF